MVMKSIFTVSCLVVMALAIGTHQSKIPPIKLINLMEDMNAACKNPGNGTCERVNEVVFNVNCEKQAYQDTFCQVNRALLGCKDFNVSRRALSDFHEGQCTSKRSLIRLKDFCSKMLKYIENFYGRCANIEKGVRLNIA